MVSNLEPVYFLLKTDHDGEERGYDEYDSEAELRADWPNAEKISDTIFTDFIGGKK